MPAFTRTTPDGDTRERAVCDTCGYVAYENPKVVVGSVVAEDGRVLLCRRAIEPRRETLEEGARREAMEEANAAIELDGVLALYSIARIGQVQTIFRGRFAGAPHFAPGEESLDVRLFSWDEIPWDDLAFPSVHWSLDAWRRAGNGPLGHPAGNPAADPRGTNPISATLTTSETEVAL